jgi:hypothetical protein
MTLQKDGGSHDSMADAESMTPDAVQAMEQRLLAAFAEHHEGTERVGHAIGRRWMAAAAAVLLFGGAAAGWRGLNARSSVPEIATTPSTTPPQVASRVTPPVRPSATERAIAVQPSVARTVRARPRPRPEPVAPAAPPSAFVALPGAASLPRFESGSIVRIDLPLSSLAAYGIDISAAGRTGPVPADVLVGQDGEPRAIRLVKSSSTPSSLFRSR